MRLYPATASQYGMLQAETLFFFQSFGWTVWDKLLEFTFEIDEGEFKPFKTFGYWIITADQQALCTETNIF